MPAIIDQPNFQLNASGRTQLSAEVTFATDGPAKVRLTLDDGEHKTGLPTGDATQDHSYPVLGMKGGRSYQLHIEVEGGDSQTVSFETAPLPDDIPNIQMRAKNPDRMEPGVTLFGLRRSQRFGAKDYGYILAVDHMGDIVWVYHTGHTFGDILRLKNGNLLYLTFDNRAIELDMLGNTVTTWIASRKLEADQIPDGAIPVDTETFHHEFIELPNGNNAVISTEMRQIDGFPSNETDPDAPRETANVVGDVICEFKPDGTVVNTISVLDVVDPQRIGYMALGGYWISKGYPNSRDWSHANALDYDPSDDSYIMSLRHQDAVIKVDRTSGSLKWILGSHDAWNAPWSDYLLEPQPGLEWQYHQHNAHIGANGNVLLFDNGNFRALPYDAKMPPGENYSRGVEFAVDADTKTVSQVWSYGGPGVSDYSPFISGLRVLPKTGNVLINFGGLLFDDDGSTSQFPPDAIGTFRMIEITGGDNPEILWDLFVDERPDMGYDTYRAERLDSLYG